MNILSICRCCCLTAASGLCLRVRSVKIWAACGVNCSQSRFATCSCRRRYFPPARTEPCCGSVVRQGPFAMLKMILTQKHPQSCLAAAKHPLPCKQEAKKQPLPLPLLLQQKHLQKQQLRIIRCGNISTVWSFTLVCSSALRHTTEYTWTSPSHRASTST